MIEPIYIWTLAVIFAFYLFALWVGDEKKSGQSPKKTPKRRRS